VSCCVDTCCGPGSYCCQHANPHDHPEEEKDVSRRIVIEEVEPCHHGKMDSHRWAWSGWCPGGTTLARSVLTEPSEEMVERAKRQMLHYLDEELFLDLEASGIVDWDWLARATLETALFSSDTGEREETE
jgi:hypothetical protein